jgi:pentatricopeptide repeat protein
VATWNILIQLLSLEGRGEEAQAVVNEMEDRGLTPLDKTLQPLIRLLRRSGKGKEARRIRHRCKLQRQVKELEALARKSSEIAAAAAATAAAAAAAAAADGGGGGAVGARGGRGGSVGNDAAAAAVAAAIVQQQVRARHTLPSQDNADGSWTLRHSADARLRTSFESFASFETPSSSAPSTVSRLADDSEQVGQGHSRSDSGEGSRRRGGGGRRGGMAGKWEVNKVDRE